MKKNNRILFIILILFGFGLISAGQSVNKAKDYSRHLHILIPEIEYHDVFLPKKDTIFIHGDEYIDICLKNQLTTLYRRSDTAVAFPISSGTENIAKGIKTSTGIFTVQSKIRLGISRQFNNAELINWIGFNGNIGFHGLSGSGYYQYLGKRPSSHGCVRISREDGNTLYESVKIGTPVIVYEDEPARVLAFYDDKIHNSKSAIILRDNKHLMNNLDRRLENLYLGNGHLNNSFNLIFDNNTILKKLKIPVGEFKKVAVKQKFIPPATKYYNLASDNTRLSEKLKEISSPVNF
ncbi:MAG: L,D-transpeptidase [Candidatus Kapabacteria bacterium]|nr:L,D-transpeptidase [Ignavibacteriota bacterium]MCW5885118.1 L,D-transpeptidase [Candidatus Kapabacteria bacterium]